MSYENDLITIRFSLQRALENCRGRHPGDRLHIYNAELNQAKLKGATPEAVDLAATLVSIALEPLW